MTAWLLPLLLCSSNVLGQDDRLPRLEDGHIDLQGVWNLANLTPLERQRGFDRLVISAAEAATIESNIDSLRRNQKTGGEPESFHEERTVEPIRGEFHSSVIVEPADGLIPGNALFKQKVAEFRATWLTAADGPEQRAAPERCLSSPAAQPPMQSVASLNLHQIVQTPRTIVIQSEWNRDARIIRMNAKHAPAAIVSWLGDSIGWWEGDTLVVETKYFTPSSHTRTSPLVLFFVSPQTVVTERFTLIAMNELHYVFTVDDPAYYTRSWTGENHLKRSSEQIFEFACHEGNYALEFVLRGGRANDASGGSH
jgi:hypothetical protein